MLKPALRYVEFQMDDKGQPPADVLDSFREEGERVINVERFLDGGYNTDWYRVWILTYA